MTTTKITNANKDGVYCVLVLVGGNPVKLFETDGSEDALRVAVAHIKAECTVGLATSDEAIREELETDMSWVSAHGSIWVYILQTERLEDTKETQ